MDLLYYPGCTLKTSAKNLEATAMAVAEALGHRFVEMEEWNCCGVVASLTSDNLMQHLGPLRNLIHVEDQGEDTVLTLCDMCYNTLKQTDLRVRESEEDLETLNLFMDLENDYKKSVRILHFLEYLRDEVGFAVLKKKVKKPLKGLRVMPYYGCMMLRPRDVAMDDAEEPTILADLMHALGAEVVDTPFKIECCGSYNTVNQKELTSKRAHKISSVGKEKGAEAIVLTCPLCRYNLDVRGKEAEALYDGYSQIPVVYYTQLIALALGLGPEVCGFEANAVDPLPLLREKGVA
jgi:heterodisulfide reductase subunit B